jgi:hypothetical protein
MKLFLTVLFFFLLVSCNIYQPVEFEGIDDYSFSSENGCNPICISLEFYNPNFYNVAIKSAKIKASLSKDDLGFLNLKDYYILKKKQNSVIELSLNTEAKSIQPILSGFLNFFIGKEVELSVDGVIKAKAMGLSKNIQIEKSFKIKY